jgi:pyridoxamine 5'-phosphate oxidase
MTFSECLDFANSNRICYLATVDGDQPRVRTIRMWYACPDGFYLCGLGPKKMWQQMKANPKVEVCFFNNPAEFKDSISMRITGKVQFLDDQELRNKVLQERPNYLNYATGKQDVSTNPVMRIPHGEVWCWTPQYILKESQAARIAF